MALGPHQNTVTAENAQGPYGWRCKNVSFRPSTCMPLRLTGPTKDENRKEKLSFANFRLNATGARNVAAKIPLLVFR